MTSELQFTNKDGLDNWYREFSSDMGLTTRFTNSASLCKEVKDRLLFDVNVSPKEKDAVLAKMLHDRLKTCAPIYECAWVSCDGILERSLRWFNDNKDKSIMSWHKNYTHLKSHLPTQEEVANYQAAARQWRTSIGFDINNFSNVPETHVVKDYYVPPGIVITMNTMLKDMQRRRNEALGLAPETKKGQAEHVHDMVAWLKGSWDDPCPWGDWKKQNQKKIDLAVTACAGIINKNLMDKAGLKKALGDRSKAAGDSVGNDKYDGAKCQELSDYLKNLYANTEKFIKQAKATPGGGFTQQGSALDTAFSSHYWAWACDIQKDTFPSLSAMLFALGKAPAGKAKVQKKLEQSPYKWASKLAGMFCDIKEDAVHMHPAVLTPGRICSEMVCSFGAFPVSQPSKLKEEQSSSPRFLLNLRSDGDNPAGKTVCATFEEYRLLYPDWEQQAIVPAEHLLHQSFLSKAGPFVNVSKVEGSALEVVIHARP